tara:strand:+ start:231 stop:740 length:510 start_codon:yes stop_codon:yes gene_type:complete
MANNWKERYGSLLAKEPENKGLMWHERMELAADKINSLDEKNVYDFGAGECRLSRLIVDKEYFAIDTENFSIYDDIEISCMDLVEEFPQDIPNNSVAVCLGFIDHIMYQKEFLFFMDNLSENFDKAIFSCQNSVSAKVVEYFSKYFEKVEFIGETDRFPGQQSVYMAEK